MAHLIDKDAVLAIIEKRIKSANNDVKIGAIESLIISKTLNGFKSFLDTLEVKEADFDAEWERYFEHRGEMATVNVKHLAKHFFELGVNASNPLETDLETEQRIKECPFREVICNRYEDNPIECDGRCSWAVDYLKLKRFKAQKKEKV